MNDTPHAISLGVAIGVFLGIFPTPFIGMILAYFFAWLLSANKASAVLGTFIMNPITTPVFWGFSAYLGAKITGLDPHYVVDEIKTGKVFSAFGQSFYAYMIGNIIISILFAVGTYYVSLYIVHSHRQKKHKV
jgi:uncharacterized protein (DUF2062 family)